MGTVGYKTRQLNIHAFHPILFETSSGVTHQPCHTITMLVKFTISGTKRPAPSLPSPSPTAPISFSRGALTERVWTTPNPPQSKRPARPAPPSQPSKLCSLITSPLTPHWITLEPLEVKLTSPPMVDSVICPSSPRSARGGQSYSCIGKGKLHHYVHDQLRLTTQHRQVSDWETYEGFTVVQTLVLTVIQSVGSKFRFDLNHAGSYTLQQPSSSLCSSVFAAGRIRLAAHMRSRLMIARPSDQ